MEQGGIGFYCYGGARICASCDGLSEWYFFMSLSTAEQSTFFLWCDTRKGSGGVPNYLVVESFMPSACADLGCFSMIEMLRARNWNSGLQFDWSIGSAMSKIWWIERSFLESQSKQLHPSTAATLSRSNWEDISNTHEGFRLHLRSAITSALTSAYLSPGDWGKVSKWGQPTPYT
jgi:hypothetical protein